MFPYPNRDRKDDLDLDALFRLLQDEFRIFQDLRLAHEEEDPSAEPEAWSVHFGPDGSRAFRRLGASLGPDTRFPWSPSPPAPRPPDEGPQDMVEAPVVTVTTDPDAGKVRVVVEPVRGLKDEDIAAEAAGERLHIEAHGSEGGFREEIILDVLVDDEHLDIQYHDDVILISAPIA